MIKTMNSKMTTNSQLSTIESKNYKQKPSKQTEQEQNNRCRDHLEGYQLGGERVRMGGKVQRLRSIIGRYQIEDVKKSIGNGEAKELTCMTHGHEPRWGMLLGEGCRAQGNKEEKKMG